MRKNEKVTRIVTDLAVANSAEVKGATTKKKKMNMDPCMGVTPRAFWEAPWVANIIFGRGCKRGFYSSTFYLSIHVRTNSLTNLVETRPEQ